MGAPRRLEQATQPSRCPPQNATFISLVEGALNGLSPPGELSTCAPFAHTPAPFRRRRGRVTRVLARFTGFSSVVGVWECARRWLPRRWPSPASTSLRAEVARDGENAARHRCDCRHYLMRAAVGLWTRGWRKGETTGRNPDQALAVLGLRMGLRMGHGARLGLDGLPDCSVARRMGESMDGGMEERREGCVGAATL